MTYEIPGVSFMALYIITFQLIQTNSRSSTHWKLNIDVGKVQCSNEDTYPLESDVPMMNILGKQLLNMKSNWEILPSSASVSLQHNQSEQMSTLNSTNIHSYSNLRQENDAVDSNIKPGKKTLDCGKAVKLSDVDSLRGVIERNAHPSHPEPDVTSMFKNSRTTKGNEIDMHILEKKLRKARKERPNSAQVFNQIGNFWRIKGNTLISIECFRKALSINSKNADVYLNLARVLFNLQYLDDAIFLTRRSLEMLSADQNSWLQHFTLGEILKAYGHFHEAKLHFKRTLDLNPGYKPAAAHLKEIQVSPNLTITYYTIFIIMMLIFLVMCGFISTQEGLFEEANEGSKTQRHFNRAMAMRSIKQGINTRLIRSRKQLNQAPS